MRIIDKLKYRFKILKSFYPYTNGIRKYQFTIAILCLIAMAINFIPPILYKYFIKNVILSLDLEFIIIIIWGYIGVFIISYIIEYLKKIAYYNFVNTALHRIKTKILQYYFTVPYLEYATTDFGDIKMRIEDDTNQIKTFAEHQSLGYIVTLLSMLISLFILFFLNIKLALFSIITVPITLYIDNALSKKEGILKKQNVTNDKNLTSWLNSSIQNWREIKALNLQKQQKRQYHKFLYNYAMYFAKWINYWTARVLVIPKIKNEFLMQFSIYFIGGILIISGELSISNLLVFILIYEKFANSLKSLSTRDSDLQANMAYTDRLLDTLSKVENTKPEPIHITQPINNISFKNVSFTYPKSERTIFKDFNLEIKKGEKVAIIGESGCGKTTLIKLLTGFLSPSAGQILYSGVDLNSINKESLYSHIGVIMQDNLLFNTSIKENLLYAKSDATDDELIDACRKSDIYDFILSLPDGFNTVIGEKGGTLSGGQRQRLVLARMFLKDVDVFIFDEATSALDHNSENVILDTIQHIPKEKTIIIVTHKISSIKFCDRIINL